MCLCHFGRYWGKPTKALFHDDPAFFLSLSMKGVLHPPLGRKGLRSSHTSPFGRGSQRAPEGTGRNPAEI